MSSLDPKRLASQRFEDILRAGALEQSRRAVRAEAEARNHMNKIAAEIQRKNRLSQEQKPS